MAYLILFKPNIIFYRYLIRIVKNYLINLSVFFIFIIVTMKPQNLHEPEPELQESIFEPSIPTEGLRILACIISRHLEKKKQQSNFKTNNTDKNVEDHRFRGEKEGHDG